MNLLWGEKGRQIILCSTATTSGYGEEVFKYITLVGLVMSTLLPFLDHEQMPFWRILLGDRFMQVMFRSYFG